MKKIFIILLFILFPFTVSYGQQRIPSEYIPPSGKISLSSSMPYYQAIQALSEISARIEQKVIIDEKTRTHPINVEIVDLVWRDALDIILKVNNLEYEEYPTYIKIIDRMEEKITEEGKKYDSSIREVNISAIFFEGDRHALKERGINWQGLVNNVDVWQNLVGPPTDQDLFRVGYTIDEADVSLEGVLKVFESESIGEVLASPVIQVLEGEEGMVQVGQDISIKQFDFAGNVIDRFISSGIILTVKPLVIQEEDLNFIYLEVSAEKSAAYPTQLTTTITKTQANTSLFLLDGERGVIAGLYSNDETKERKGIPILKDLPGWFFGIRYLTGYDRNERTEKELVVIIKAELVPTLQARELIIESNIEYIERMREELRKKFEKD